MIKSSGTRVFLSYAWKDDQPFVERLYDDLRRLDYNPWMDKTNMPSRGRSLPREVEEQLQVCDRVIAVMGPDSIASEACRAERAFASSAGKVITAILRKGEYQLLPSELSRYFVPDFRVSRPYEMALDELQRVLQDPLVIPGRLFDVPALPPHVQPRPDELSSLCESITAAELKENAVITSAGHVGLQGMGGVGKTVMAALAARDYTVRRQFQNGIIWLTFGRQPNVLREVRRVLAALGSCDAEYDDVSLARMQLGRALEGKECLLILDDVWSAADAEPFVRAINPRCRLLITTRNLDVVGALGARATPLDVLTVEQSRALLAQWTNSQPEALPPEAPDLIQECGRLPLALAMIGAMLCGKPRALWEHVSNLLRDADLEKIRARFPDYPYVSMLTAIQVSVDALREEDAVSAQRYLALAVMLEDMAVAPAVQQTLWNVDEGGAIETAEQLIRLSLAQRDTASGGIRLHDLQLDYVKELYADQTLLELIHGAVRLSAHAIEKDARQFASQVVGRLLVHRESPGIGRFIDEIAAGAPMPWLRLLHPALHPSGTPLLLTLEGHSGGVDGVAVTPDGKRAVSGSTDKTLKLWDLDSGRALLTLEGHSADVHDVAVTPDGKRAVSASGDKTLKVWDLDSGRALLTLEGHSASVYGVAVTPDGKRAVSASWDKTLKVWDLDSGRALLTLEGHSGTVNGVAVTPDGKWVVSASGDKTLKVWDLDTGRVLRTLEGHSNNVFGVAVTPDGKRAVSASWDKTLKVWDLDTGRVLRTLEGHSLYVQRVAVTPDGKRAVSASWDRTLKVWDLDSGRALLTLEGNSSYVNSVVVTPDGNRAVSASLDIKVWEIAGASPPRDTGRAPRTRKGHSDSVYSVAVSPDGKRAVSASCDTTLKVWDLDSGRPLRTLEGHSDVVEGVVVTPDGKGAVSASWDRTLKVWDLGMRRALRRLQGHSGRVFGVAVTPNGKRVISASDDKTLKVWDLDTGSVRRTLEGHSDQVIGVAVTPDGRRVVSASWDTTLKVWDLDTGRVLRTLEGHSAYVHDVAVTPDGKWAISASGDHTLKMWDLDTGLVRRTLEAHSDAVRGVAVTRDGARAVSASADHTLKVWDLDTGEVIATFHCDEAAHCCAFADERRIVAGDGGGRVYILRLEE